MQKTERLRAHGRTIGSRPFSFTLAILNISLALGLTSHGLAPAGLAGPLTVSSANPRYFVDSTGKVVLLGGSHHWINFIDSGTNSPPPAFDYDAYLDFLTGLHHNFFRLWAQGLPKKSYSLQNAGPWYQSPQAWLRTGPGNATDGLLKFDLTQFNQAYFDRLRLRVQKANERGIYVSIMLFDGYHLQFDRLSDDGFPLTGANNINGIDDGGGTRSQNLSVIPSAVLAVEEDYVRKVIDTVNDLPNVLYEIANEAGGSYSTTWQQHFIAFVKNYEASKGFQHPVGFTFQYSGGTDSTLYSSGADWVSPSDSLPANDGTRHVILNDTDHSYFWVGMKADGPQSWRNFVWRNFTAGNSALFMDPYLMPWTSGGNVRNNPGGCVSGPSCTVVDPFWDPIRKNIGYMLDYANSKLDLVKMTPRGDLASTSSCLANAVPTNAEYLVYAPNGGSFTVNLSATSRPLNVEWLNPSTGAISSGGTVTGGASSQLFTPPFSGNAVLYLLDVAGHAPPFMITSIARGGNNDVNLVWNGRQGTNVVQISTGGSIGQYTGNYLDLASNILSSAKVTNYTHTGGAAIAPSSYYRIRLVQP